MSRRTKKNLRPEHYQGLSTQQELSNFGLGLLSVIPIPLLPPYITVSTALGLARGAMGGFIRAVRNVRTPVIIAILSLIAYWFAMQITHDHFFKRSAFTLMALMVISIAISAWTGRDVHKLSAILAGFSAGAIAYTVLNPTALTAKDFAGLWKYGIATPVTILAVWLISKRFERTSLAAALLVVIAVFSLGLNFRSHAICCLAAAAVIFIRFGPHGRLAPIARYALNIIFLTAAGGVAVILPKLIESGLFGKKVAEKTLEQSSAGGPLLLAGRTEPPMSFSIIQERPWFGWGDLARVPEPLITRGLEYARKLGFNKIDVIRQEWYRTNGDVVSVHSHLAQFWAEGGIFPCLMIFFLIFLSIQTVLSAGRLRSSLSMYLAFQMIWDTLFSTSSNQGIILWGLQIPLMLWLVQDGRSAKKKQPAEVRQDPPSEDSPGSHSIERPVAVHPMHYSLSS